jgi:hypothetical protein
MKRTSTIPTNERMAHTEAPRVPRSRFDLTHNYSTTMSKDKVFPVLHEEVLPGDVFDIGISWVSRLLTPLTPLMDNIFIECHAFFVPNRLIWDNWEKFMHADYDPDAPVEYLVPVVDHTVLTAVETTYSYLKFWPDLPWKNATSASNTDNPVNALPFRGPSLIYNEWFRDQDLQDKLPVIKDDGPDTGAAGKNMEIFKTTPAFWRSKKKDYFTTARPWPQKGPDVLLPIGSSAPIVGDGGDSKIFTSASPTDYTLAVAGTSDDRVYGSGITTDGNLRWSLTQTGLIADLATANSATLAQFREAATIQQLLVNHFGVQAEDFRLQRPEFIGMVRNRLGYQSVTQTSESGTTPQANLAATAASIAVNQRLVKSFVEHGQFYIFASVVHDQTYQDGLPRKYRRRTRHDFYFPTLANLSEQAQEVSELYYLGNGTTDSDAFGYIGRWDEYRWKESRVGGVMRSNDPLTLDSWHLAYDFGSAPALNDAFIRQDMPLTRTISVDSEDQMLLNFHFDFKATRPLPVRSTPGLWRI